MKVTEYTWRSLTQRCLTGTLPEDIPQLIFQANRNGIGNILSRQKSVYSLNQLAQLKRILRVWQIIDSNSIFEFRSREMGSLLRDVVITSISKQNKLDFFSVFCPSYKKGLGASGYTGKVGNHTKHYLSYISKLVTEVRSIFPNTNITIFFSDLLLENYSALAGSSYKRDLERNYSNFLEFINGLGLSNICTVKKLSDIPTLKEKVGESGIMSKHVPINDAILRQVFNRNKVFYTNELGWSDEMVMERTVILADTYLEIANALKLLFPNGIAVWAESAYERGLLYSDSDGRPIIPIIYPLKS